MISQSIGQLIIGVLILTVLGLWLHSNIQEARAQGLSVKEGIKDGLSGCYVGGIRTLLIGTLVVFIVWAFDGLTSCSGYGPEPENYRF